MTSLLAKYLIVSCIIVYTSVTSISSEGTTTESILSTLDYSTVPIECDIFEYCCQHINTTSCLGENCTRINCTTTSVSTTHFNLTSSSSSSSLSTAKSSFANYTTVSISTINSTETVSNITTQGNIPAKKDSRTSLKIFLIFVAIVVVIAVIVIAIGRRHCCNAVKTNITAKFNVKKDSELEYIIDDGEFMNPDDPPVLAEMKVTPNNKRKKTKKEESLHSLSGKNKDGSLQLYGATTSAALPC